MELEEKEEVSRFDNMDYIRIAKNALRYWWTFVISIGIALGVAWFKNKTATPLHKAGTLVLLKDETKSGHLYEITQGFGLSREQSNLENQKYIYTSPKMVQRAIKGLNFEVTMHNIGRFVDTELYSTESDYEVQYDTLHQQPIGAYFETKFISQDIIQLHVYGEQIWGYNYLTGEYTDYYAQDIDTTLTIKSGETLTNEMFSITIKPYANRLSNITARKIRFNFNTTQSVANAWKGSLDMSISSEGSTVAYITVTGTNRKKMLAFLKGLNEASVQYNLEKKNETATRTLNFIRQQIVKTADSVSAASERMKHFMTTHSFKSRKQYGDNLQSQYFEKDRQLQELLTKKEYLEIIDRSLAQDAAIEDYFTTMNVTDNNLLQSQLSQLVSLQKSLNEVKFQSDNNPHKKTLIEQEELLRSNIRTLISQTIATYQRHEEELKAGMHRMMAEADKLPDMETEYNNLQRDFEIQNTVHTFLLQKESETLIAKASNTADNDVLQEPFYMGQISPNTKKNYTTAGAIGFIIPAAILFLIEFLNEKVRTLKELKKTIPQLSVIGIIPQENDCDDTPMISRPQSAISESFRTLRTKLKYLTATEIKTIMFSSCNPGEGKTFCAINTAISYAQTNKKCLLMNYDLRRPRTELALNLPRNLGITDYLVNDLSIEDITIKTDIENLYVIPSGTIPPNPSELVASEKNRTLIEQLKKEYDIIIIDTAPVGCVADSRILKHMSDVFLFVVRANKTDYNHLKETIDSLLEDKTEPICLMFNGASHSKREYSHYGSYYTYYPAKKTSKWISGVH